MRLGRRAARLTSYRGVRALVTGASSGIGRALALRLARDGARLALLDRDAAALGETAAQVGGDPAALLLLPCDVTDWPACRAAFARIDDAWGGADVLVNNAGISHVSPFEETEPDVIRRVVDVNLFGAVHCTKAALPGLLARRGAIVAVSSVAGFAPLAWRTGYAASKHALHGFFDSLRAELAPRGVSVSLVCPSFARTRIGDHALGGDGGPIRLARGETGRLLEPEAVAEAIRDAALRRRRLVRVGGVAHAAWWLTRLAPALYERIMARRMRNSGPGA
jgi:NAD(P)-dependent dehydrogenase (short-subunit alcohol dehydrogenase family)